MSLRNWSVICFCADWCGTCRDYQAVFKSVAEEFAHIRFGWFDIEDDAVDLGGVEIETFPTILVVDERNVRFAGALQPHAYNLRQLLLNLQRSGTTSDDKLTDQYQVLISGLLAQPEAFTLPA